MTSSEKQKEKRTKREDPENDTGETPRRRVEQFSLHSRTGKRSVLQRGGEKRGRKVQKKVVASQESRTGPVSDEGQKGGKGGGAVNFTGKKKEIVKRGVVVQSSPGRRTEETEKGEKTFKKKSLKTRIIAQEKKRTRRAPTPCSGVGGGTSNQESENVGNVKKDVKPGKRPPKARLRKKKLPPTGKKGKNPFHKKKKGIRRQTYSEKGTPPSEFEGHGKTEVRWSVEKGGGKGKKERKKSRAGKNPKALGKKRKVVQLLGGKGIPSSKKKTHRDSKRKRLKKEMKRENRQQKKGGGTNLFNRCKASPGVKPGEEKLKKKVQERGHYGGKEEG